MIDAQFHLPISHWEPGDGHGSPLRRVDVPPTGTPYLACFDCREAFIPVFAEQRRCPCHQLVFDVIQSHAQARRAGPGQ